MDGASATAAVVRQDRRDGVLLLIMAERPINTLSPALRAGLADGLTVAAADPDLRAVVICSGLLAFSAGIEPAEAPVKGGPPNLAQLCQQIENLGKPVVVAIGGSALGGGMELALAAHGRVALATARLGCPEVSLGLVPKAGATQRLPRLIGAEAALRLLLEPGPVTAAQALAMGLVDLVVEADLIPQALDHALTLAADLHPPRKTADRRDGFRDPRGYQAAVAAARARHVLPHLPAAARAIDCVEAAQLLLLDQGLAFEAAAYADLAKTRQAQGLTHAFVAEQRAVAPPRALAGVTLPVVTTLGLWGGGDTAADLAVQALTRGMWVMLADPDRTRLVRTVEQIAARQDLAVSEGRLSAEARDGDWARLGSTIDAASLAGSDLVLTVAEAGPLEPQAIAPHLPLGALPLHAGPGKLALQPAPAPGLAAELSATEGAAPQVLAKAAALARRLGWRLFFTGPGGPVDRHLRKALAAAIAELEAQGLPRATVAASLASYGIGVAPRSALPAPPPETKQVLDCCLAALANAGAHLLGQGVLVRASDVDAMAVMAGVFPRWQGGPMFWADQRGLLVLRSELRHRAETQPQLFTPDPLFDRLIAEGRNFAAHDAG